MYATLARFTGTVSAVALLMLVDQAYALTAVMTPTPAVVTTVAGKVLYQGVSRVAASPGESIVIKTGYVSSQDLSKISIGIQIFDPTGKGVYKNFVVRDLKSGQPILLTYTVPMAADGREGKFKIVTSAFVSSTWTQIAANEVAEISVEVPTIKPAVLTWSDEFETLNLMSAANPLGTWRPNSRWQNISSGGFKDFAGTSWNINPNHPAFAAYSPFSVEDGVLTIRSVRTPPALRPAIKVQMDQQGIGGVVPAWSGGYLVQNPKVRTHRYGYFEYRARWPNYGKGMFPALWLLGSEGATDPLNKGAAEIDIVEMFGVPGLIKTTLHMKDNAKVGDSVSAGSYRADITEWHTYGVDWQPDALRFYFDGRLAYEVLGANARFYTTTMSIRLNYAMDAIWFDAKSKSDATTPDALEMHVDYVRVYDRFPY